MTSGIVLLELLFTIMIADIDKDIVKSVVRSFFDDTKETNISSENDVKEMKEVLKIYIDGEMKTE